MEQDLFGNPTTKPPFIERDLLARAIFKNLSGLSLEEFASLLTNPFNEIIEYSRLLAGKPAAQKTSLLFNPHRLNTRTNSSKESIFSALKTEGFCSGLARAVLFKEGKVSELLFQAIQLGINGVQYVNEFPPLLASELVQRFGAGRDSKILDPCAGWGGRMLGVSATANNYEACEPSARTHSGLIQLGIFIQPFRRDFSPVVHKCAFEDARLPLGFYDMALTSPPYFDTELYSTEAEDSATRYRTFADWKDGFFLPMIRKTMAYLKPEGVFILNVGGRKYPLPAIVRESLSSEFAIAELGNLLSGHSGLGREGEGEVFFEIRQTKK